MAWGKAISEDGEKSVMNKTFWNVIGLTTRISVILFLVESTQREYRIKEAIRQPLLQMVRHLVEYSSIHRINTFDGFAADSCPLSEPLCDAIPSFRRGICG
jgi:hypothetical protein